MFQKSLELPENVWGLFDWISGVIRINVDYETYINRNLSKLEQNGLDETYYHEIFHCVQICTSGFLSYHVLLTLKEVFPTFLPLLTEQRLKSMSIQEIFESAVSTKIDTSEALKKLFRKLDTKSDDDISVRDIIESAAYFAQKHSTYPNMSQRLFESKLPFVQGNEYKNAYIKCADWLYELNYEYFCLMTHLALCFKTPEKVFKRLCILFYNKYKENNGVNQTLITTLFSELENEQFSVLGNAKDVQEKYTKRENPFYIRQIRSIEQFCVVEQTTSDTIPSFPHRYFKKLADNIVIPIILNPDEVIWNSKNSNWKQFDDILEVENQLIFACINLIMTRNHKELQINLLKLKEL